MQVLEVDNFSHKSYQALSIPCLWEESLGTRLHIPNQEHNGWWLITCDAPGVQGICVPMISSSNLEGCVKLSIATPPSSMSSVVSFRWEVTGWEEVTSLDGRNGGEGEVKGSSFLSVFMQSIQIVNSNMDKLQHISLSPPPILVPSF